MLYYLSAARAAAGAGMGAALPVFGGNVPKSGSKVIVQVHSPPGSPSKKKTAETDRKHDDRPSKSSSQLAGSASAEPSTSSSSDVTTVFPVGSNVWVNYYDSPRPGKLIAWKEDCEFDSDVKIWFCTLQIYKKVGTERWMNRQMYIEDEKNIFTVDASLLMGVMMPFASFKETKAGKAYTLDKEDLQFLALNMKSRYDL